MLASVWNHVGIMLASFEWNIPPQKNIPKVDFEGPDQTGPDQTERDLAGQYLNMSQSFSECFPIVPWSFSISWNGPLDRSIGRSTDDPADRSRDSVKLTTLRNLAEGRRQVSGQFRFCRFGSDTPVRFCRFRFGHHPALPKWGYSARRIHSHALSPTRQAHFCKRWKKEVISINALI